MSLSPRRPQPAHPPNKQKEEGGLRREGGTWPASTEERSRRKGATGRSFPASTDATIHAGLAIVGGFLIFRYLLARGACKGVIG